MTNKPLAIVLLVLAVAGVFVGSVLFIAGVSNANILAGMVGGFFLGVSVAVGRLSIKTLQGKPW